MDWSYDLPFLLLEEKKIDDVVIISFNDNSLQQMGQDPANFNRALHAKLLNRLEKEGARLVVFDILFIDTNRAITAGDLEFAKAIKQFGKVVLAGQYYENRQSLKAGSIPPIDLFREVSTNWGFAKVHWDSDFAARLHWEKSLYPSLAWRSAESISGEIGKHPEERVKERWLNYYSPEPFEVILYEDALANVPLPKSPSFRNKFVFVGSGDVAGYAGEEKEAFRYPWTSRNGHFPFGVEIHALAFSNLVRQDWLRRMPLFVEIILIGFFGALLGYSLSLFRPLAGTVVALVAAISVAAIFFLLLIRTNIWFPWMIVVSVQIPLALGWSYLFQSIKGYVETKLLETSLGLYLSPIQVKQILKQPDLLKPGAVQKTVSILFSDIANFSKISERMDPDDLVKLLNNYYETAISCIHKTEGTVMNLIGDAILAIWNAPQDQKDHQARACQAALLLNESLVHFDLNNRSLPLRTRVGLHTGTVCVGNIGSATHFDYTAIGESVNLASRLEGLNKQLGTNILATRDMQKSVENQLISRLVGHFRFKGFDQVVQVHELIGGLEAHSETESWREIFETALHRFQRSAFDEAERGFCETLKSKPNDGPSKFYLERIRELRLRSLPSDWAGEIDLREK